MKKNATFIKKTNFTYWQGITYVLWVGMRGAIER